MTLTSLSMNTSSGKNIGNITEAINRTVINGTPLQNSINPIEAYFTTGYEDLLPKARNIPTGKQKSIAKIDTIKVSDKPPQAPVSTHTNPKLPPEIKLIAIKGKINNRKIIIYFLIFGPTKNAVITVPISIKKAALILHISASGYSPYINRVIQNLIKSQHAPSPVHSSLVVPIKLASKNNQFKRPGIVLINTKITNKDKIALNQFEFIFLFKLSNVPFPENSILM